MSAGSSATPTPTTAGPTTDSGAQTEISSLPSWAVAGLALILVGVLLAYGYTCAFSQFAPYDDEGLEMISVQGFLRGKPLYDQVLTVNGPFYYFYEWLLHSAAKVPLTHDATRMLCITHWLIAASLLALAGGLITRSSLVGLFLLLQAGLHLAAIAHEPSHPQELVVVLLGLAAVLVAAARQPRPTLAALSAIAAAALFTKTNVGAFFVLALALSLCSRLTLFESRPWTFWVLLAASSLLPFILMRHHIHDRWARVYAAQECIAIFASGLVAHRLSRAPGIRFGEALLAAVVFVSTSALFLMATCLTGSSLACILRDLLTEPSKRDVFFWGPVVLSHPLSCLGALLAAVCAVSLPRHSPAWQFGIAIAKTLYGVSGAMALISHRPDYTGALGCLLPWTWLLVAPLPPATAVGFAGFARVFLCFQGVWQGLQAFPVPGTQLVIATFLPILAYWVCLHDAISFLVKEPKVIRQLGSFGLRARLAVEVLAFCLLTYLTANRFSVPGSLRINNHLTKLSLPGTSLLRLTPNQAQTYAELTRYLRNQSDAFITIPGFNSLYFWTEEDPPTYFNTTEIVWMNEEQQAKIVQVLRKARHPMVVLADSPVPLPNGRTVPYVYPGALARLVRKECREVATIGQFRILALQTGSSTSTTGR